MTEKIEKVAVAQVEPDELQINITSVEVQDGYLGKLALYKVRFFFTANELPKLNVFNETHKRSSQTIRIITRMLF